jgi:AraC-like DNA-binding protein
VTEVKSLNFSQNHAQLLRARAIACNFDAHLHNTYSIVALKRGRAEVRSSRWVGTVNAGDVFFFNPFEVHAAASAGQPADYETFYLSSQFVHHAISRPEGDPLTIQTNILSECPATKDLIEALSQNDSDQMTLDGHLRRLIRLCNFSTEPPVLTPRAVARRACRYIETHCSGSLRTDDLANEIGVHRSHLIRAFTSAVGIAPQTYIRQVRIAKASDLICAGFDLSEVAQMLSFADQSHFSREFKKVFGVPPGKMSRDIGPRGLRHNVLRGEA